MQIKLRKTIKCHLKKIIRAWKKFNQVKLTARMLIFNRTADSLSAIVIFARPFSLSRPNFPWVPSTLDKGYTLSGFTPEVSASNCVSVAFGERVVLSRILRNLARRWYPRVLEEGVRWERFLGAWVDSGAQRVEYVGVGGWWWVAWQSMLEINKNKKNKVKETPGY